MTTRTSKERKTSKKPRLPRKSPSFAQDNLPQIGPIVRTPVERVSKRDQLASLLLRDEGATIEQMMALTGWLAHTVRAALTGLKKLGYAIDSDKAEGLRTYRAVAPK